MGRRERAQIPEDDPLWYKDAVVYEVHVRAFYDSNGDGIGDFPGLTQKLDYLKDLGVSAIWLLPFYPSPLRDDGYDIADYKGVHRDYGTLRDFRIFLRAAHERGLRVITELVINHTSEAHVWFQRARRAPPSDQWREYYVWSDTPDRYADARVIFKDFEHSNWSWDVVARSYYWHRFYAHQPDLNFDNPAVRRALLEVISFWADLGVDGFRLDAVPYLFEREGTNCENLPETHRFLKELRRHLEENVGHRMLLAEANQWPDDASAYFGGGDECHMAFHFPLMPRLFMGLATEDRFGVVDVMRQTPEVPEACQWALFLRNHDELTLEMVTDEERDYMYRAYAHDPQMRINLGIRRRLAPLLSNNRRKIELMNGLLFSLPGTPVIYYGDEIGMGDNIYLGDRNGVRVPMQWSADRNAGFSRANPQRLFLPVIIDPEYHFEALNVEAQQGNPHSLLWWMRRLIALRKQFSAFGRGSLELLEPENPKVLAFLRRYRDECVLVVANLSRFAQCVELDLAPLAGTVPVELFGRTEFPAIGQLPYFITLGPHAFYWFLLEPRPIESICLGGEGRQLCTVAVAGAWEDVFRGKGKTSLERAVRAYLSGCRWFRGKARPIKSSSIVESIQVSFGPCAAVVCLVHVEYTDAAPETYLLPLAAAEGPASDQVMRETPGAVVGRLRVEHSERDGVLYDATADRSFCEALLDMLSRRRRIEGAAGELRCSTTRAFKRLRGPGDEALSPSLMSAEQTNTSVVFGDRFILKIFRCIEEGVNLDLEVGRFLTERQAFAHVPAVVGAIEYRAGAGEPQTCAILQAFVPNAGDAWRYTLDELGRYLERVLARTPEAGDACVPTRSLISLADQEPPVTGEELIAGYPEAARLLGQRTAELHTTLCADAEDPVFAPEPFSAMYQRSLYQSIRALTERVFPLLGRRVQDLPEPLREQARHVRDLKAAVLERLRGLRERRIGGLRIRCHGDYHLGQVLYTGKDFVIIDFEGEPARPLTERRLKRSPLRDVAGMLRSFHYAAYAALFEQMDRGIVPPDGLPALEPWLQFWCSWVSAAFLTGYLTVADQGTFLPRSREEREVLLDALLLEKAIYELGYELNNRPAWVRIPLQGITGLLEDRP